MPVNFSKQSKKTEIRKAIEKKKQERVESYNFRVSFQYLDHSQKPACSFKDWQKVGLLSHALEVLTGYCKRPLMEQVDGIKFALYGDFPPPEKTKFRKPEHVPEDAHWGRIHINGKSIIAGYVVHHTFYVVFLDKHHHFYLTKKQRGE